MKHTFIQKIVFLLVLFFSSVVLSHGTLIIPNVEHKKGYIHVAIYDSHSLYSLLGLLSITTPLAAEISARFL